jgi:hypothetical protein
MKQKICREREYFRQGDCLMPLDVQKGIVNLGGFARTCLEKLRETASKRHRIGNLNCLKLSTPSKKRRVY